MDAGELTPSTKNWTNNQQSKNPSKAFPHRSATTPGIVCRANTAKFKQTIKWKLRCQHKPIVKRKITKHRIAPLPRDTVIVRGRSIRAASISMSIVKQATSSRVSTLHRRLTDPHQTVDLNKKHSIEWNISHIRPEAPTQTRLLRTNRWMRSLFANCDNWLPENSSKNKRLQPESVEKHDWHN